jgi:hypothetical protein
MQLTHASESKTHFDYMFSLESQLNINQSGTNYMLQLEAFALCSLLATNITRLSDLLDQGKNSFTASDYMGYPCHIIYIRISQWNMISYRVRV